VTRPSSPFEYTDSEIAAVSSPAPQVSTEEALDDFRPISRPNSAINTPCPSPPSSPRKEIDQDRMQVEDNPPQTSTTVTKNQRATVRALSNPTQNKILRIEDHTARRIERIALDRERQISKQKKKSQQILCKFCLCKVNSNLWTSHVNGRKHQRQVKKEEEKSLDLSCKRCNKKFVCLHDLNLHFQSASHRY